MKSAILFCNEDERDEAIALAKTAGYNIINIFKKPKVPNSKYYIQEDKFKYIKEYKGDLDAIIIFDELKPRQFSNLMKEFGVSIKILDKILLILEIFSLHAGSQEAKLQIELARLKHELPIIKDIYRKTKLKEQQGPLGAGIYGVLPLIRLYERKINKIKKELEELKKSKEIQINRNGDGIFKVAIVGYTNAGKTSIFNALTGLSQKVDNSMFTTTSPKRYGIHLSKDKKVILIDTVGFIRGIPPQIIEAFFVTLSEAKYADTLLLVIDGSQSTENITEVVKSSFSVLREIGIYGKPVILVINKIDQITQEDLNEKMKIALSLAKELYNPVIDVVGVSALKGYNLDLLRDRILKLMN